MNFETYIIVGVGTIILLQLIWIVRLEIKLKKLLGSKNGSLDDIISIMRKDTDILKKYAEKRRREGML